MATPTFIMRELRGMMPFHPLTLQEAKTIAEAQATILLHLLNVTEPAVDTDELIARIPRVAICFDEELAKHGFASSSTWQRGRWVIGVNPKHDLGKQRFAAIHELKHIIDARAATHAYQSLAEEAGQRHEYIEHLADHFAACLLMPQAWVLKAIRGGYRGVRQLAMLFMVPPTVMRTRLRQLGITFEPQSAPEAGGDQNVKQL
jgi:Zn-dependent peptidase ImmA (M78 family)